ncbi:MAG: ABC transporter ATP-binding protein [Candidatus Diapherotrites archaeon]|uniref:ABC transporter ATP-binding protein n=1 Tax=Candidatus Iainarchaeum sp. TaxID=3101447 RepID=A0A939C589_9ARCH|nr:ABC transporter ATP-binding protein [Candidatus Diapherotrites archaeon]
MKSAPVIQAKNVSKIYQMGLVQVKALDGVDLSINQGEFVAIMGPSGSGKTTLLDVVSALLRPTKGEVYINGSPISKMDDNELAKVRGNTIGFIFQTFNLISRMNALENVMLPLWFAGKSPAERRGIAEKILRDVGLAERMTHKPSELSGGQRQRVAIARALAVNPDVVVADEPTGNLDSASGEQILQIIKELHEGKGKTVVMVTHERDIALRAEKILYLKDGKIIGTEDTGKTKGRAKK